MYGFKKNSFLSDDEERPSFSETESDSSIDDVIRKVIKLEQDEIEENHKRYYNTKPISKETSSLNKNRMLKEDICLHKNKRSSSPLYKNISQDEKKRSSSPLYKDIGKEENRTRPPLRNKMIEGSSKFNSKTNTYLSPEKEEGVSITNSKNNKYSSPEKDEQKDERDFTPNSKKYLSSEKDEEKDEQQGDGNSKLNNKTKKYLSPEKEERNSKLNNKTKKYLSPEKEEGNSKLNNKTKKYLSPEKGEGNFTPNSKKYLSSKKDEENEQNEKREIRKYKKEFGFNITTEMLKNHQKLKEQEVYTKENRKTYFISVKEQKILESEFIRKFKSCPEGIKAEQIIPYINGINPEKFKSEFKENFYNGDLMKVMTCLASSFTLYSGENALSGRDRIKEFISNMKEIGGGAYGYALSASLINDKADNFFVVKGPKSVKHFDELVHEVAVAFIGTNDLRNPFFPPADSKKDYGMAIPNFSYIYGIAHCSAPFIDSSDKNTKQVLAWCNTNNMAVDYAIYENISPVQDFAKFNKNCTASEFMMYYMQTMLALREAILRCEFTHYDLHTENAMLKKVSDKDIYIPYYTSRGKEYIRAEGQIVTIIDYGMSHVVEYTKDGRKIHYGIAGSSSMEPNSIYRDKCTPICDVYKLLGFSLRDMIRAKNNTCYEILKSLLEYFNKEETPEEIILKQEPGEKGFYYAIPNTPETENFDIDNWIEYCRSFIEENDLINPFVSKVPKKSKIMHCDGNCQTFDEEMITLGIDLKSEIPVPNTFVGFYDSYGNLKFRSENTDTVKEKEKYVKIYKKLAKNFMNNFNIAFEIMMEKILSNERNIHVFVKTSLPIDNNMLFNRSFLKTIKNSYSTYVQFFNSYQELEKDLKIWNYIKDVLPISENSQKDLYQNVDKAFNIVNSILDEYRGFKENLILALKEDFEKLKGIKNTSEDKNYKADYNWYWDVYPVIEALF